MKFCNRCGCPLEEPIRYADEVCIAHLHIGSPCDHVPMCVYCTDVHRHEILGSLSRADDKN